MSESIDYEKCKTSRPGLYYYLFLIWLAIFSNTGSCDWRAQRIYEATKRIEAMQPCSQPAPPTVAKETK